MDYNLIKSNSTHVSHDLKTIIYAKKSSKSLDQASIKCLFLLSWPFWHCMENKKYYIQIELKRCL
jgi:hypothetical protein